MTFIKVAAGVVNQTPMAWDHNFVTIQAAIADARSQNVSVLCLPELCITGYSCEDYFFAPELITYAWRTLEQIVPLTSGMAVAVGLPISFQNRLYNAACLIVNGQISGFYCKQHLANNGLHYEKRWFHAWPKNHVDVLVVGEKSYPIGDLIFELGVESNEKLRLSFEICEDAWVADRPGRRHYERGVDLILNPSASHFAFGKFQTRERLVIEGARSFSCSYIYTNLLGNEAGQVVFDGDAMVASNGQLLVSGPRFGYADHYVVPAVIDTQLTRLQQIQNGLVLQDSSNANWLVREAFEFPSQQPLPHQKAELESFERGGYLKEEEFARAIALGLFDYLRKSRSNGFTISLSGGADSCACAALAHLMIRYADESIGIENLKKKLSYIQKIQESDSIAAISKQLIQTIYQGTKNSSTDTLNSAQSLAESIDATFYQIVIDDLVNEYQSLIESQIGRPLTWEKDDITLQNIQARVRAPGVWMLTNLSNNLLIATSNRSEVAVGYATMDGDTAGSISPIAGIEKFWLRQWLIWLEKVGSDVKGKSLKVEGLAQVNALQPTAELRPKERNQTDEADLMPYDVLNSIEGLAIRDKKSPIECFKTIVLLYQDRWEIITLHNWVARFFRLWSRNQWKRERYAPSFHLDDYNLNPRSWCRFPILSGGFTQELNELEIYFKANY